MKKILSILAISVFASVSLFAQSSRIAGKWSSSAGAQTAMLEAMGGKLEEAVSIMTFNEDGKSEIYSKVKSIVEVSGIEMTMVMEIMEHDTWTCDNNILKLNVKDIEVIELEITLSGLDRKVVDKVFAELKKEGAIVSPVRCKWTPAQ